MNEKTENILRVIGGRIEIIDNHVKTEQLMRLGDTFFDITWQDLIKIVKEYGFKCGFCHKFTGTGFSDKKVIEEEVIFFHEEKGLILHATSIDGNKVCCATVYGEVKSNEMLTAKQLDALKGCLYIRCNKNNTMSFLVDVQEAFKEHLNAISEAFGFSKSWTKVPFMYFLNYMEVLKNYDYKKISMEKVAYSKPEVRKIIFG